MSTQTDCFKENGRYHEVRWSSAVQEVVEAARQYACNFGYKTAYPEHLLHELVHRRYLSDMLDMLFKLHRITTSRVKLALSYWERDGILRRTEAVDMNAQQEFERILFHANTEAERRRDTVQVEDLLVALLSEPRTAAAHFLFDKGLSCEMVRDFFQKARRRQLAQV